MRYNFGLWAMATGITTAIGFLVGALLQQKTLNPASMGSHFIAPILAGIAVAAINRQFLSKIAYFLLPFAFCLAQIVAFSGLLFLMPAWGVNQGDTLISDILVQYVPFALAGYLLYQFYSWSAGRKAAWIMALQVFLALGISFSLFSNALNESILLLLFLGGSTAILSLLHFQPTANDGNPQPTAEKETRTNELKQ